MSMKTKLLDLFFPPHCPLCGQIRESEDICPQCQQTAPWIDEMTLPAKGEFFEACYAPLWYTGLAKHSFHRYKFNGRKEYATCYAMLMAQSLEGKLEKTIDMVTWAPLHSWRRWRRGYDQAQLLAQPLAEELKLPLIHTLVKRRNTKPQSTLHEESQRRANSMGAYRMMKDAMVSGKRILLVDDVLTTGSTMSECARILRTAGAKEVYCVTLARADCIPKQLR